MITFFPPLINRHQYFVSSVSAKHNGRCQYTQVANPSPVVKVYYLFLPSYLIIGGKLKPLKAPKKDKNSEEDEVRCFLTHTHTRLLKNLNGNN